MHHFVGLFYSNGIIFLSPINCVRSPNEEEREGYAPNVVYSTGSMIQNENLIIPYAMSDYASTYATVKLEELLNELIDSGSV